ncbi:hypothetical protein B0H65DRAFT_332973 [Neurospora tetraspora]|uniref:Uncharacterized protein n=1 Tax=Neurospora tetraspora TaxID=94610 RepID=A0AAE0MKU1_9PEZI|nr:hypothetical protein B0H65DRAFT_332973 [Neurospora tetraspora]
MLPWQAGKESSVLEAATVGIYSAENMIISSEMDDLDEQFWGVYRQTHRAIGIGRYDYHRTNEWRRGASFAVFGLFRRRHEGVWESRSQSGKSSLLDRSFRTQDGFRSKEWKEGRRGYRLFHAKEGTQRIYEFLSREGVSMCYPLSSIQLSSIAFFVSALTIPLFLFSV